MEAFSLLRLQPSEPPATSADTPQPWGPDTLCAPPTSASVCLSSSTHWASGAPLLPRPLPPGSCVLPLASPNAFLAALSRKGRDTARSVAIIVAAKGKLQGGKLSGWLCSAALNVIPLRSSCQLSLGKEILTYWEETLTADVYRRCYWK